jgi:hypothetical protein
MEVPLSVTRLLENVEVRVLFSKTLPQAPGCWRGTEVHISGAYGGFDHFQLRIRDSEWVGW